MLKSNKEQTKLGRWGQLLEAKMRMKSFLAASAVAIGLAAFVSTVPSIAYAQHYHGGGYYGHGGGWGWGGFAAGAAAGAILGGIAAAPYYNGYYGGPYYAYEPVPGDAVAYCMRRFKSYDPGSGTYLGYDGYRHACP
jgi:BA14K-like protein